MSGSSAIRYAWSGRDREGRLASGEAEAADVASLRRLLYQEGVLMSSARKLRPGVRQRMRRSTVASAAISVFLRQCASLLSAGLPLVQVLDICADSTPEATLKTELVAVREQLAAGSSFCTALRGSALGKDALLLNLIQAAEQAGTLDTMMTRLARDREKAEQLRARVKKALTYPLAVLAMALVVSVVLLIKVVPQFARSFAELGAELPALTQSVLTLSALVSQHVFKGLIMATLAGLALMQALRRYEPLRWYRDRLLCRLPVIGTIVQQASLARLCQILAGSLRSGLPLLQALQSAAPATGNLVYERACHALAEQISQGQSLSFAVRRQRCFPVMIAQLIHAGEQSGTLDQMLENCALRYEQSVDNAVDRLSSLIEPVIMSVLGVIIATLLLAMYLPVFRLGAVL